EQLLPREARPIRRWSSHCLVRPTESWPETQPAQSRPAKRPLEKPAPAALGLTNPVSTKARPSLRDRKKKHASAATGYVDRRAPTAAMVGRTAPAHGSSDLAPGCELPIP